MKRIRAKGQALVELAIVLPVLLLLLAGGYVGCRAAFLLSASESAAFAETIRRGRRLTGIEEKIAGDILPRERLGVAVRFESSGRNRFLPSPFPSLAGRTIGIVDLRKGWEEIGGIADLPDLRASRSCEASVDSWERRSDSGKTIRRTVEGYVATGIFR
jgi:hypothetical protein